MSKPLPLTELSLIIAKTLVSRFGFKADTNWRQLTDVYLPKHLQWTGLSPGRRMPDIHNVALGTMESRVHRLIDWAYEVGVLCRLFMWLEGSFFEPARSSPG